MIKTFKLIKDIKNQIKDKTTSSKEGIEEINDLLDELDNQLSFRVIVRPLLVVYIFLSPSTWIQKKNMKKTMDKKK